MLGSCFWPVYCSTINCMKLNILPLLLLVLYPQLNCLGAELPQGSSETLMLDISYPGSSELKKHSDFNYLLKDPENRISSEFQVPESIKDTVGFWLSIYATYTQNEIVFFDELNPSKVLFVQDDRDLLEKGKTPIVIEITSKQRFDRNKSNVINALNNLAKNPSKNYPSTSLESSFIKLYGKSNRKHWLAVRQHLKFQRGQKDIMEEGVQRSLFFMNAIENIFSNEKINPEMARICLLESSFQLEATSKADAVGVWQFLEKSAKEYLIVNKAKGIDERLSPMKSSVAAARLLKRNQKITGHPFLAIIAYNHGAKNLTKFKGRLTAKLMASLLDPNNKKSPLGYASRNYLSEFFATLYVEKYKDKIYNILPSSYHDYVVSFYKIKKPSSFFEISSETGCNLDELKRFNPDLFSLSKKISANTVIVVPKRKLLTRN